MLSKKNWRREVRNSNNFEISELHNDNWELIVKRVFPKRSTTRTIYETEAEAIRASKKLHGFKARIFHLNKVTA